MNNWLPYTGAFSCSVGVAAAGFVMLTPDHGYSMGALIAFGPDGWLLGAAFLAVATAACFGHIMADVLEKMSAAVILVVLLFRGGLDDPARDQ